MILREFIGISLGNLWRMKLRTALTVSGIMIGIGALVSMLSFGFGIQRNVSDQFHKMGLLTTLQVRAVTGERSEATSTPPGHPPVNQEEESDQSPQRILNAAALDTFKAIPGVSLAYPLETFDAYLLFGNDSTKVSAQALPAVFADHQSFGDLLNGRFFTSDTAHAIVLSEEVTEKLGLTPDSALGQVITLRTTGRSSLINAFLDNQLAQFDIPPPARLIIRTAAESFLNRGEKQTEIEVTVCGVAELRSGFGYVIKDVLVPTETVAGLDRVSFSNPLELMNILSSDPDQGWKQALVVVEHDSSLNRVSETIEDMGFEVFSFAGRFDEIKRNFAIFDLMMSAVGFIAVIVSLMGIVNTMVMSVTERKREIGILKSLGGEESQIRLLFLVESGVIGLIGSVFGLILGWAVSEVGSLIFKEIMRREGGPVLDMFLIPWWMIPVALGFGITVSILAGLYPAARAAHVDPVKALRNE